MFISKGKQALHPLRFSFTNLLFLGQRKSYSAFKLNLPKKPFAKKSKPSPYLTYPQRLKDYKMTTTASSDLVAQKTNISSVHSNETASPVKKVYKPIVWIDCEMTGLDHHNDYIIEICCIITDGNLKIVDEEGYESVIHCPKSVMDNMGQWCIDHHGSSGLTEKVIKSDVTKEQVDLELLAYIKKYIPDSRVGILAGNSVHVDRLFMLKDLPQVVEHLTYRIIDVSSIMEVCRRHNSELSSVMPRKEAAHTAKSDILESIEQLKFYRTHYLKSPAETKDYVVKRRIEIEAAATEVSDAKRTVSEAADQENVSLGNEANKKMKN
ncbi:hypothetical protein ACO0RG_003732 [Hanseniaspora osmophila]|uniref:Oligoribonuclease, mitochondrial n=1 Tax=Hanseniaspora osmophila TaxID=56408 RepID=A0A1E5RE10_9ASCO|nr:Oligoribonuclease, mitochondrial [Hanseniaspora osmophila]